MALDKIKKFFYDSKTRAKRALWHSKDRWRRLTAGMELEELWTQFKSEAQESSRLYKQDLDLSSSALCFGVF